MNVERQREHFNKISDRYREARTHENHLHLKEMIWTYFLKDHKDLRKPNLKVLEAMCGYAEGQAILNKNLDQKLDYQGFDYSDDVVDHMNENHPELKIFHQDVTQFDSEETFDLIILIGGLHHVPDSCDLALERLYKSLKPGGSFINLEPTHGFFLTRMIRERIYEKNTLFDDETERAFEVDEYFDLFERNGFELRDAIYPGLLSYVLYYNPDAFPLLNQGSPQIVETLFQMEVPFLRTPLARSLSFATLAIWKKPE